MTGETPTMLRECTECGVTFRVARRRGRPKVTCGAEACQRARRSARRAGRVVTAQTGRPLPMRSIKKARPEEQCRSRMTAEEAAGEALFADYFGGKEPAYRTVGGMVEEQKRADAGEPVLPTGDRLDGGLDVGETTPGLPPVIGSPLRWNWQELLGQGHSIAEIVAATWLPRRLDGRLLPYE